MVAWFSGAGALHPASANHPRETKKVVWPSRKETRRRPGLVFVFMVVMALFLWLTDKSLEWVLYDLVLGWK